MREAHLPTGRPRHRCHHELVAQSFKDMKATTEPADYQDREAVTITVHAKKENARPIGFAAWSTKDEKRKTKRKGGK